LSVVRQSDAEAGFVRANLRWNFIVLSLDFGLFGLGLTLASLSTVVPAFAERLGAPNLLIGALPAIQTVGWALPAALAANYIEQQARKLPLVLVVTVWERVPYLFLGAAALLLAERQPTTMLALIPLLVAVQSFSGGAIMPAWLDIIAKVIPVTLRGRFFAVANIVSGLTGVGGAALVGFFLDAYPFPLNYALCFFACFGAMVLSFFCLASTREPAVPPTKPRTNLRTYVRRLPGIVRGDHNFAAYLGVRALALTSTMGLYFYTVFALRRLHAQEEQVAVFTFFLLAAQTASTAVWGWLADRYGHRVVLLLGLAATVVGSVVAFFATNPQQLYAAFAMMGAYLGAVSVSHQGIILEFSRAEDRPTYVGLVGTLTAPFAFVAPLVGGLLADNVGFAAVFATSAVAALASLGVLAALVREPRHLAVGG